MDRQNDSDPEYTVVYERNGSTPIQVLDLSGGRASGAGRVKKVVCLDRLVKTAAA